MRFLGEVFDACGERVVEAAAGRPRVPGPEPRRGPGGAAAHPEGPGGRRQAERAADGGAAFGGCQGNHASLHREGEPS